MPALPARHSSQSWGASAQPAADEFVAPAGEVLGRHGAPPHGRPVVILAVVLLAIAITSMLLLVWHRPTSSAGGPARRLARVESERAAHDRAAQQRVMADLADRQAAVRALVLEEPDRTVVRARVFTQDQPDLATAAAELASLGSLHYDPAVWE